MQEPARVHSARFVCLRPPETEGGPDRCAKTERNRYISPFFSYLRIIAGRFFARDMKKEGNQRWDLTL